MLNIDQGTTLLRLARNAIALELGIAISACDDPDWVKVPGATFVTLMLHGRLRGCIGSLEAHRPLADDVRHNAIAAAFHDPRFDPLDKDEFGHLLVEVSLLSDPEAIAHTSETDALAKLVPGIDGVILQCGMHRATYLPQVWEQLPDAGTFISSLKRKAGLPIAFWSDEIRLSRYRVQKWSEEKYHG